jgi:hypothetical protein
VTSTGTTRWTDHQATSCRLPGFQKSPWINNQYGIDLFALSGPPVCSSFLSGVTRACRFFMYGMYKCLSKGIKSRRILTYEIKSGRGLERNGRNGVRADV